MQYQATYRRTSFLVPALVALILGYIAAAMAAVAWLEPQRVMATVLWLSGGLLPVVLLLVLASYRRHAWTIVPGGIAIAETPRVPLTGLSRRVELPFARVRSVRRVENGIDLYLDLADDRGHRFRLPQAMVPPQQGLAGRPDPDAPLDGFLAALTAAAIAAGAPLPPARAGLGFFASLPGLAFIAFLLLLTLGLAGTALWAFFDGADISTHRGGGMGLVLLAPVAVGWLLRRAWRQRRRVLDQPDGA